MNRRRIGSLWSVVGLAAIAAGLVVTNAGAADLIPNPGFELNCGGVPCQWTSFSTGGSVASITRDTANPHAGSASLRVDYTATQLAAGGALSTCVFVSPGSGLASVWYRTTNAPSVHYAVFFYTSTDCSGGFIMPAFDLHADNVTDGVWHQLVGTATAPPGSQSVQVSVSILCSPSCGPVSANFDDVVYDPAQIAVTLASFTASRAARGVALRWRTASEADMLGFHVYRERAGKRVRVDKALIPTKDALSGARYSFLDRRAPDGTLRYRLQAVNRGGSHTWLGSASVVH